MKRLQLYYPDDLVVLFRTYAKVHGISLAEVIRKAGRRFAQDPTVQKVKRKKAGRKKHSILDMAGIIKGGPKNGSMTVDDIYLDEND